MTLERPEFLLALILVALPAATYLSRYVRSRKEPFPAASFLFGRDTRPLDRLRSKQILVTLIRVCLVALLVVAFARPVSESDSSAPADTGPERAIILLDVSASMSAGKDARTAFAAARAGAAEYVSGVGESALFEVHLCPSVGPAATQWLSRDLALARLASARQGWGDCQLTRTLERLLAAAYTSARIVVFSDFSGDERDQRSLDRLVGSGHRLELVDVGSRGDNLGLSSPLVKAGRLSVVVESHQAGGAGPVPLTLKCGDLVEQREAKLEGRRREVVEVSLGRDLPGGTCSLSLPQDAYTEDNTVWFEVVRSRATRVVLVEGAETGGAAGGPAFFVAAAIRAARENVAVITLGQPEFSFGELAMADVLVLIDPLPMPPYLERGIARFVETGGRLWLLAGSNLAYWKPDSQLLPGAQYRSCVTVEEQPFRVEWMDREDKWLAGMSEVTDAAISGWASLRHTAVSLPGPGARVLARFSDGVPAFVRLPLEAGGGKDVLLWSIVPDSANGNFAFHPLFPIAVASFADRFTAPALATTLPAICSAGRKCTLPGEPGAPVAFKGGMSGKERLHSTSAGDVVCREPGPYFTSSGGVRKLVFSCVANHRERHLRSLDVTVGTAVATELPPSSAPPQHRSHAHLFLAGVVLLLLFELVLIAGRRPASREPIR